MRSFKTFDGNGQMGAARNGGGNEWGLQITPAQPNVSRRTTFRKAQSAGFTTLPYGKWQLANGKGSTTCRAGRGALSNCAALPLWQRTVHKGVISVSVFLYAFLAPAFPLDEFKGFINSKPTVEEMAFRMRGVKNRVQGTDVNTFRPFRLTFQDFSGSPRFSLLEDRSGLEKDRAMFVSGAYDGRYWHLFNSNDVITAIDNQPRLDRPSGPSGLSLLHLGSALDALNMGIFDLGLHTVVWKDSEFFCLSNAAGVRIEGRLVLDDESKPAGLNMRYSDGGAVYSYRVSYQFDGRRPLPAFFPSNIKIELIRNGKGFLLSEYDVISLRLTERDISFADVDYAEWLKPQSKRYVFTNNEIFRVRNGTNGMELIRVLPGN